MFILSKPTIIDSLDRGPLARDPLALPLDNQPQAFRKCMDKALTFIRPNATPCLCDRPLEAALARDLHASELLFDQRPGGLSTGKDLFARV